MASPSVGIDAALVSRLLAEQFPGWADLPLAPVASPGTDNALFRLGDDMVVRLPRVDWAAGQARKEHAWLPRLAPALPLAVPAPLALGSPAQGYPWAWTVCRWITGRDAFVEPITDLSHAAESLAAFLQALWRIDTTGGPRSGEANNYRGVRLIHLDDRVRACVGMLDDEIDAGATTAVWESGLAAPVNGGPRVWLHGDLHPANLLTHDGQLSAIVDFGLLGVGDPAADIMVAWSTLDAASRPAFRAALGIDDAAWARGRSWAIYNAVGALSAYRDSNPTLAGISRRMLAEALLG